MSDDRDSGTRIYGSRVYGVNLAGSGGRLLIGVVVLGLGVLWTLENLGFSQAADVLRWWPALLVLFGLVKLTGVGGERQPTIGVVALTAGVLLLAGRLGIAHIGIGLLFPVMLIVLGVNLVRRAMRRGEPSADMGGDRDDSAHLSVFAMMGAVSRRAYSQAMQTADVTAVMAGAEVDLRDAKPASGRIVVDVFAMWGGIEILVPQGWRVLVETTPIMGAVEDETVPPESGSESPTVVVRGVVLMGGVEVRHDSDEERKARRVRVGVVTNYGRREDGVREVRKTVVVDRHGIEVRREYAGGESSAQTPPQTPPASESTPPIEPR